MELAYRYDLFITPDWRDRFDTLVNDEIKLPTEGRILDVNCGTGAHSIELAARMAGAGEVVGVDPSAERVEIARAKAQAKKIDNVIFEQSTPAALRFESFEFDAVIGDASMLPSDQVEDLLAEVVRGRLLGDRDGLLRQCRCLRLDAGSFCPRLMMMMFPRSSPLSTRG